MESDAVYKEGYRNFKRYKTLDARFERLEKIVETLAAQMGTLIDRVAEIQKVVRIADVSAR